MDEIEIRQTELDGLLGDGAELLTIDARKKSKRYTAARIAEDEKKLSSVIQSLVDGYSKTAIAQTFSISRNTINAIEEQFPEKVEQFKKRFARMGKRFAGAAVERLYEEVDSIPIDKLAVSAAVIFDKIQIVEGGPTVIHADAAPAHQAINDMIDALENSAVIDVEAEETGCVPEEKKQIGASGSSGVNQGGVDSLSTDSEPYTRITERFESDEG